MFLIKQLVKLAQMKNVNHVIQFNRNFAVNAMKDIIYLKQIKQNVQNVQLKDVEHVLMIYVMIALMIIQ